MESLGVASWDGVTDLGQDAVILGDCAELAITPAGVHSLPKPAWWPPWCLRL